MTPDSDSCSGRSKDPAPVSLTTADGRLRVDFQWNGDRFVQHLAIGDSAAISCSVEGGSSSVEGGSCSVEGGDNPDWPPSPPIQQLSLETINGEHVVLGVGAAGQCHWSISVEQVVIDDNKSALKFDLACRCKTNPQWLGSTYQRDRKLRVEPLGNATIDRNDHSESIRPDPLGRDATRRWSYLLTPADEQQTPS